MPETDYLPVTFVGQGYGTNLTQLGGPSREQLQARVAALEDCLKELAPFAECFRVDMQAHFLADSEAAAQFKGWAFKRDTLFIDQRVFRKIAKLLKAKP